MMLFSSGNAPRKIEEKWSFLLYFARFALSLMLRIQCTHVREYKRKMYFLFVFYSLNRTFAKRKTNKQRYGRNQKTVRKEADGYQSHQIATQRTLYMGIWLEVTNLYRQPQNTVVARRALVCKTRTVPRHSGEFP